MSKYYVKLDFDYGKVLDDGTLESKNPVSALWRDMDYAEAVAFQNAVIIPALNGLVSEAGEAGMAVTEMSGDMAPEVAEKVRGKRDKNK